MYGKKKKTKYNNGGLVARKEFKGIGSIEGNLAGDHNYTKSSVAASVRKGGTSATASYSKDSRGNSNNIFSFEKQLPNKSSIGVKIRKNPQVTYHKQLGGGFNLKVEANKNYRGMSISKPL
jgi:hypothetical protein